MRPIRFRYGPGTNGGSVVSPMLAECAMTRTPLFQLRGRSPRVVSRYFDEVLPECTDVQRAFQPRWPTAYCARDGRQDGCSSAAAREALYSALTSSPGG